MEKVKTEVIEKLSTLSAAGFGLVAALAWNSAIQGWFERQGWLKIGGPWIYALIVTVLVVVATMIIGRISSRIKEKENKEEKKE